MAPTKKMILRPPAFAPGKGMTEAVHAGLYYIKSASFDVASDTSPVVLFRLPKDVMIEDVIFHTTTAFATGSSIEVGTSVDTDCFNASSDMFIAGSHSMKGGAAKYSGGYLTTADMDLQVTVTGASGAGELFVIYSGYADEDWSAIA